MLIGDFSVWLQTYLAGEQLGAGELLDEMQTLDRSMGYLKKGKTRRAYYHLIYFLLYQLTENDALVTSAATAKVLASALVGMSRPETSEIDVKVYEYQNTDFVVLRRRPVIANKLSFEITFIEESDISTVAPWSICFIALEKFETFHQQRAVLSQRAQSGRKYAFLIMIGASDITSWIETCRDLFEPFDTCIWIDMQTGCQSESVVTLITHGVTIYEI